MDTIQSKIEKHQKILTEYINDLAEEKNDSIGVDFKHFAIVDTKNNHFQLIRMGWWGKEYIYKVLIHMSISAEAGNIWVWKNDTEIPVDVELAQQYGVIKKYLTVGWLPTDVQEVAGYATA